MKLPNPPKQPRPFPPNRVIVDGVPGWLAIGTAIVVGLGFAACVFEPLIAYWLKR